MPGLADGEEFLARVYRRRTYVSLQLALTTNYFSDVEMARRCPRLYERYLGELAPLEIPELRERFRVTAQDVRSERRIRRLDRAAANRWRTALPRLLRRLEARQMRDLRDPPRPLPPLRVPPLQRRPIPNDGRRPPFATDHDDPYAARLWNTMLDDDEDREREEAEMVVEYRPQKERREDLIKIMQKRFIEGEDEEFFDYSSVDYNEIFDDEAYVANWNRPFFEVGPGTQTPNLF